MGVVSNGHERRIFRTRHRGLPDPGTRHGGVEDLILAKVAHGDLQHQGYAPAKGTAPETFVRNVGLSRRTGVWWYVVQVAMSGPVALVRMSGSSAPSVAAPGAAPVGASVATDMPRAETSSFGAVNRDVVMSHDQADSFLSRLLPTGSAAGVGKDNGAEPHTYGGPVAHGERHLRRIGAITR